MISTTTLAGNAGLHRRQIEAGIDRGADMLVMRLQLALDVFGEIAVRYGQMHRDLVIDAGRKGQR